jgi:dCTP deaminase
MTILNDREIRQLCLVPTHCLIAESSAYRYMYSKVGDRIYSVTTGQCLAIDQDRPLELKELSPEQQRGYAGPRMIEPFEPEQVKTREVTKDVRRGDIEHPDGTRDLIVEVGEEKIISYGTSSFGYDVRLGSKFKIFTNVNSAIIDPLNMPDTAYVDFEGDICVIPPNSYVLGHTLETFEIPRDVTAICVGKSTYARAGCGINVTPIEAGFKGQVVIEISNLTPLPMKVYANMGIAQFLFFRGLPCEVSYGDRAGKYQGQTGITTAKV